MRSKYANDSDSTPVAGGSDAPVLADDLPSIPGSAPLQSHPGPNSSQAGLQASAV